MSRSHVLFYLVLLSAPGCATKTTNTPVALPSAPSGRELVARESVGSSDARPSEPIMASEGTSHASSRAPLFGSFFSTTAAATTPGVQLPVQADASSSEMIDIQARFAVQCDVVQACADKLRRSVYAHGGRITSDEATAGKETDVTLELRVPAERFDDFAAGIDGLGPVGAREIKRRDVAKEYHDSELLLHERQIAFDRFEALLKEAKTVQDTIQIEQQLERLRTEMDRIKGDMFWLKDRVAAATVAVSISPSATSEDAVFAPEAILYPGLRATMLFDLRSETERYGYLGAGVSIQFKPFGRVLTFDVDLAHTALTDRPTGSDYVYLFTAGFDLYSDLLGGGRRRFLNPFLGFRVGYSITNGLGDFAFGGVVGVDIVKTKAVMLDLHALVLGMVGNDQGPHVLLGPELGFSFAF